MDKADAASLLERARRGSGGAKMITAEQLMDLYSHAARHGLIVDGIEPFRLGDEFDVPHVELTITANELHEAHAALSWEERISAMGGIIADLLQRTQKIGGEFRFNAWVSEKSDWIT